MEVVASASLAFASSYGVTYNSFSYKFLFKTLHRTRLVDLPLTDCQQTYECRFRLRQLAETGVLQSRPSRINYTLLLQSKNSLVHSILVVTERKCRHVFIATLNTLVDDVAQLGLARLKTGSLRFQSANRLLCTRLQSTSAERNTSSDSRDTCAFSAESALCVCWSSSVCFACYR